MEPEPEGLKGGFKLLGGASATAALGNGDNPTTTTTFTTMKMDAMAKPKALMAGDICTCPPSFDSQGFELKVGGPAQYFCQIKTFLAGVSASSCKKMVWQTQKSVKSGQSQT